MQKGVLYAAVAAAAAVAVILVFALSMQSPESEMASAVENAMNSGPAVPADRDGTGAAGPDSAAPPRKVPGGGSAASAADAAGAGGRAVLVVHVLDAAEGSPIAGAEAALTGEGLTLAAESDITGTFRIETGKPGKYHIRASAPGYVDSDLRHQAEVRRHEGAGGPEWNVTLTAGSELKHRIRLARGLVIRGEAVDESGKPVEGATASLIQFLLWIPQGFDDPFGMELSQSAKTDWKGSFLFARGFPAGSYRMYVGKEGFETAMCDFELGGTEGEESWLRVVLKRPPLFRGRVLNADGKPIEGATVFCSFEENDKTGDADASGRFGFDPGKPQAVSDASGRFALNLALMKAEGWGRPMTGVLVSAVGFAPCFHAGLAPSENETDIRLQRAQTAEGTVSDDAGNPLPGARVLMIEFRGAESALLLPAEWMRERCSDLVEGPPELVFKAGRMPPEAGSTRPAQDIPAVERLGLWSFNPALLDAGAPGRFYNAALADQQGRFRLEGVPDDGKQVRLMVFADGEHMDRIFSWTPESPIRFVLERRPWIEVSLADEKGAAVPSFEVWIHPDWDKGGRRPIANGGAVLLPDACDRTVVAVHGTRAKAFEVRAIAWGERRKVSVTLD